MKSTGLLRFLAENGSFEALPAFMTELLAIMNQIARPDGPRPRQTRQDKIVERRQSLLEAAVTMIARKGLTGVTMSDIAAEAACAYGVVAFHFKSKDGIILAALDHMVEEYDRTLERPKHATPEARLKAMIDLDFDSKISGDGRIAVFTAFWAEASRNPDYRKRCAELKQRYHAATKADISDLASRYGMELDADIVARSLNALIDGLWISGQVLGTADAAGRKMAKRACEFYLKSVFPEAF